MKNAGLIRRLNDLEMQISEPVKLKWLLNPSKKKAKKWEKKGYTVIAMKVRDPIEGCYSNVIKKEGDF